MKWSKTFPMIMELLQGMACHQEYDNNKEKANSAGERERVIRVTPLGGKREINDQWDAVCN